MLLTSLPGKLKLTILKNIMLQVVKGGFGARRSKYLRQADPTFAELTEETQPVTQNGFNSSKNGYKVPDTYKHTFISSI